MTNGTPDSKTATQEPTLQEVTGRVLLVYHAVIFDFTAMDTDCCHGLSIMTDDSNIFKYDQGGD